MINKENDQDIIYSIREIGDEIQDVLFKKYEPLIKKIAHEKYQKQGSLGIDIDDFIQEGYIGLNSAINNYDVNEGVLFFTYATICIKRQIQQYSKRFYRKKEIKSYKYYEDNDSNLLIAEASDVYMVSDYYYEELINIKNQVPFLRSCIFELKYNGFSYREISKLLDISEKEVDRNLYVFRKFLRERKFKLIFD